MFEDEMKKLLDKKWEEDEHKLISRLLENLVYYKRLMSKSLKTDIILVLELCNKLKTELEDLKEKIHVLNDSI
jgi:hypothetical protein